MVRIVLLCIGLSGAMYSCRTPESQQSSETKGDFFKKQKPDISGINVLPREEYPKPDAQLGEKLADYEYEYAALIARDLTERITARDGSGQSRRDAHPKAHGCVSAKFTVEKNLSKELAKGVFIPGKSWNSWIRFSNGDSNPNKPDIEGDARGFAIKLLDVNLPGPRLLEIEKDADTQDFILISSRRFIINEPESYYKLIKAAGEGNQLRALMALGFKGAPVARALTSFKTPNPFQTEFFSSVPYQLGVGEGRKSVKYAAVPCDSGKDPIPTNPDANYLRAAMKSTLAKGPACFNFYVQVNNGQLSVEDSITEWKEKDAPMQKVATILIDPRQNFDTKERQDFCEHLSFNPWHSVEAHKPLGSTNRLRKVIYEHISRVRHERNKVPRKEP